MGTAYPTALDDLLGNQPYVDGTTIMEALALNNIQDAVDALQEKVGLDDIPPATDNIMANKKYVDDLSPTYDGTTIVTATTPPVAWTDLDLPELSSSLKTDLDDTRVLVYLQATAVGGDTEVIFKTNGHTATSVGYNGASSREGGGTSGATISTGNCAYLWVMSDATGVIEWMAKGLNGTCTVVLLTYQKVN